MRARKPLSTLNNDVYSPSLEAARERRMTILENAKQNLYQIGLVRRFRIAWTQLGKKPSLPSSSRRFVVQA
jgi:hypothetical protein